MIDHLLGESWDVFQIEGRKAGVLHRVTTADEESGQFVSTLKIVYGQAIFKHEFRFYNRPGFPPHSYLFDTNDGAPVFVKFRDGEMICQIDEEKFIEVVPADTRPSYGNFPLVVTMPFEEGHIRSYTQVEDGSCTVLGKAELVSKGFEEVRGNQEESRLWRVDEYLNGQAGNSYWLDENRQLKLSQWKGAISFQVATKTEALEGLSDESLESIKQALDVSERSSWIDEIDDWLNQSS